MKTTTPKPKPVARKSKLPERITPVEIKTIATLIDELCTVSQKCWHQQEAVFSGATPALRHAAAVEAHEANKRRCELMRALDRRFAQTSGVLAKTF